MSALIYVKTVVIPTALAMLPLKMTSPAAAPMLLAIGLQESRFEHRRQIGGPACGFWQFERGGGVRGVLNHPSSKPHIESALTAMGYNFSPDTSYGAIEHNDILACVFARLLLWTLPQALPKHDDADGAWHQYISAWRPGKPHRATWNAFYDQAWA